MITHALRHYWRLMFGQAPVQYVVHIVIWLVGQILLWVVPLYLFARVVAKLVVAENVSFALVVPELVTLVAINVVLELVAMRLLFYFEARLRSRVSLVAVADYSEELLSKQIGFYDSARSGQLLSKAQSYASALDGIHRIVSFGLPLQAGSIVAAAAFLATESLTMAVGFLMCPILLVIYISRIAKHLLEPEKVVVRERAAAFGYLGDGLANMRAVNSFMYRDRLQGNFHTKFDDSFTARIRAVDQRLLRVDVPLGFGVGAFVIFTMVLPFLVNKNPQETAQLLAFASAAALQLGRSLWNLQAQLQNFLEHCGSLVESLELIEGNEEEPDVLPDFTPSSGEVRLENVSFAYERSSEQRVLDSLSIRVADRESVGLVGFSGAGKSTLLALLLGFERPTQGRVLIDGYNINHHSRRSLRSHISYVPQDPSLMHLSVAENIALGAEGSSAAEIEEAARRANAYDFIQELPAGMETVVGERGVHLSGGQRQRIALARALLKPDTRVLLLDEATSSLDSWSETLVQDTLQELNGHLSLIVVAHRLSTVKGLDRILVLDQGQVVEDGSHNDLVDNAGIYTRLWAKQTLA